MTKSQTGRILHYVIMGLAIIGFGGAGAAKLAGVPMVHQAFAVMGLPVITGYIVGALQIAGVIGLLIRPLRFLAALGLSFVAVGAFAYHVNYTPIGEGVPALVLLACTAWLAFSFRPHAA